MRRLIDAFRAGLAFEGGRVDIVTVRVCTSFI
jgi:hypothetical protein